MKTTIEMPDDLFRKAKAVAALHGQSMKDLITQLLQREIGAPPAASAHVIEPSRSNDASPH